MFAILAKEKHEYRDFCNKLRSNKALKTDQQWCVLASTTSWRRSLFGRAESSPRSDNLVLALVVESVVFLRVPYCIV